MSENEDKLRSALSARADAVRVGDPQPGVKHRIVERRRQRHRRIALGSGALAVLVVIGVLVPVLAKDDDNSSRAAHPTSEPRTAQIGELKSQLVRDTRPAVPASAVKRLVAANTETAIDLYGRLGTTPGNVFFSPYSITTALTMAAAGARGQTLAQMLAVLHNQLPAEQIHPTTNALNLAVLAPRPVPDVATGDPLELEVANSLWGQAGFAIEPAFLDTLARNYGAALNTVDFERAATKATATINSWVDAHTNHMIPRLLEQLSEQTRLMVVNAVHFKGSWAEPFGPAATQPAPFTTLAGKEVAVPFMHSDASTTLPYASGPGWQALDLPYLGDASMTVIMPTAGTLADFDRSLDADRLSTILKSLRPGAVAVAFPKFALDDKSSLGPMLRSLGMTDAFGDADFSGVDGARDLVISEVVHEARLTVDENGTEAAAASAVGFEATAGRVGDEINLTIDHPFVFLIRDTKTGTILFMGRVTDPTQRSVQQP